MNQSLHQSLHRSLSRPIEALFSPASVAVVGASQRPTTWGYWLSVGALAGRARRRVYLVNPRGGALDGVCFMPSLAAVGDPVELVVVAVPAASFGSTVDDALAAGARAVVAVTAGVAPQQQADVAQRVRDSGAVLLGPNCMGVFDAAADLRLLWGELPPGEIGLVSQSGNLALDLGRIAARSGLGFSRFASLGNAADVSATELLRVCATDEATRAVALYLESIGDGRALLAAAGEAVAAGKPVVLLAAGRSAAGAAAARSHTGALVADADVLAAACRAAGVVLVQTPTELVEATRLAALSHRPTARRQAGPTGGRVGIVGDGGGHGVIAADLATAAGLHVVPFSSALAGRLAEGLPPTAATANPVDLGGGGERDMWSYAATVGAIAISGEVDAVLLTGYFGAYAEQGDGALASVEAQVADAIAQSCVPVLVHSMAADSATSGRLAAAGVPVWPAIEHAVLALRQVVSARPSTADDVGPPANGASVAPQGYFGARAVLESVGVRFARAVEAHTHEEVLAAAEVVGYPVVLKATGVVHKSDVGGVVLGLGDAAAVNQAWESMRGVLPPYSVEQMVDTTAGVEMVVGAKRDPTFGPVVMVGFGGVYAEVWADVAVGLAPLDRAAALQVVGDLRAAVLLGGFRGRPPANVEALADVVVAVSRLVAAAPRIRELDLNPVLCTAEGALALDVHIDWCTL